MGNGSAPWFTTACLIRIIESGSRGVTPSKCLHPGWAVVVSKGIRETFDQVGHETVVGPNAGLFMAPEPNEQLKKTDLFSDEILRFGSSLPPGEACRHHQTRRTSSLLHSAGQTATSEPREDDLSDPCPSALGEELPRGGGGPRPPVAETPLLRGGRQDVRRDEHLPADRQTVNVSRLRRMGRSAHYREASSSGSNGSRVFEEATHLRTGYLVFPLPRRFNCINQTVYIAYLMINDFFLFKERQKTQQQRWGRAFETR